MKTVILLSISNIFMTFAWYGHLKQKSLTLFAAIFISWFIALFEYMFQVPANRIGYQQFSATQLKIIQEIISISVFVIFAFFYFKEIPKWNHVVSFVFILGAVYFAVGFNR
jgi:uncharacterized protein (DUF486 family)